jgi:hypothetical protein
MSRSAYEINAVAVEMLRTTCVAKVIEGGDLPGKRRVYVRFTRLKSELQRLTTLILSTNVRRVFL